MKVKRKSPYRHTVHTTHRRYTVSNYERGTGPKGKTRTTTRSMTKLVPKKRSTSNDFSVRLEYADASYEHVDVTAPTYVDALDHGLAERRNIKPLHMIRLKRL